MNLRRSFWLASILLLTGVPPAARAACPDVWESAAQPARARGAAALREAQRVYLEAREMGTHTPSGRDLLSVVRMILEKVDAAQSSDPRVAFLYGRVLVDLEQDARALEVLRAALARAPDHPDAGDAWFTVAIACARLGDPQSEVAAYQAQLSLETDPSTRAITLSNQAEGYMVLGDLDTAIATYRQSLDLLPDNALARWGLAVALDRSGDSHGALAEAATALTFDPDARRLSGADVFFVPAYDRFWYLALAMSARARDAADPKTRMLWWERAALSWRQYLDAASPSDPWLATARSRSAMCDRELARARSLVRSAPKLR